MWAAMWHCQWGTTSSRWATSTLGLTQGLWGYGSGTWGWLWWRDCAWDARCVLGEQCIITLRLYAVQIQIPLTELLKGLAGQAQVASHSRHSTLSGIYTVWWVRQKHERANSHLDQNGGTPGKRWLENISEFHGGLPPWKCRSYWTSVVCVAVYEVVQRRMLPS